MVLYREVLRGLRDVGQRWDEALVGIDMATLLDPSDPYVRSVVESTREILVRLGAKPFVERLDAAMGRSTATEPSTSGATRPAASRSATPS
jgi:hypothetical protein